MGSLAYQPSLIRQISGPVGDNVSKNKVDITLRTPKTPKVDLWPTHTQKHTHTLTKVSI